MLFRSVDPRIQIEGNPPLLEKLFVSLLSNAADAMRPEGGEVRILSRLHEGLALIEVSDDGTGVPHEIQDRLFEPFLSSKGDRGAGLGLLIAREIARQQGGDLTLRSSSPQGASFAVSLQVHTGASHLS